LPSAIGSIPVASSSLRQAEDAAELLTDGFIIEEVIAALEDQFRARVSEDAWPGANAPPIA
jgi:hypothetical protein